ncbi:MAG TPA: hypothetical protein VNF27_07700 [Candidatus Binataceae bacterium]|nr:hypothetical protein [Candidatus Binataceae bacterium]
MRKISGALPVLLMLGAITMVPACASQQAENTTNAVTDTTADTTSSLFSGIESVILFPFRLLGDLFA